MRRFDGSKLVIATHNAGKLREISALLAPFDVEVTSAGELGLEEPEETEATFIGNARIKAHFAAKKSGLPALADDSGIEVDALDGRPGVYTADWAETPNGRDFAMAMSRVWEECEAMGHLSRELPVFAQRFASRGRTVTTRSSKARPKGGLSGQCAARTASGLIRCSCPMATIRPLVK